MKAITIIEMMCRLNDCDQMNVFDCYDETCTEDCYLAGYFGAKTQVGAFEAGHKYFYVWDADEFAVEQLSKIEKPNIELCTLDNGCIYLWKIE